MSTISTHVLDTSEGRPASGVVVTLERLDAAGIHPVSLGGGVTDADGRLRDLLAAGASLAEGTYRLRFPVRPVTLGELAALPGSAAADDAVVRIDRDR